VASAALPFHIPFIPFIPFILLGALTPPLLMH